MARQPPTNQSDAMKTAKLEALLTPLMLSLVVLASALDNPTQAKRNHE